MGLGKTYSTRYLADSNNNTGAAGQVLISTATGIDWSDGSDIIGGPYLPLSAGVNFPLTGGLYGISAFFSSYIKFGGYSYIGEDLTETDSLTIASDNTESIFFAHHYPATSTYTTTMEISPSGELKMPMAADGNKLTVQSSLTPFNNIIEIGQTGSDGYLDVSAAGGNIVTHLSGYTGYASYFLSNVGIGNTTVGAKLDVSGSHNTISVRVKGDMGTGAYYYGYLFDGTNLKGTTQTNTFYSTATIAADTTITDYAGLRIETPSVAATNAVITNNYGIYQASNLQKNYFAGNVGIGTTSPLTKLEIKGAASTRNALSNILTINGGDNVSNPYDGFGVGAVFKGRDYSNALRDYAYIYGAIEDQTSSSTPAGDPGFESQLRFYTNTGGTSAALPTQKMVITSAGAISFGSTGTAYGTSGQILKSNGNASPTWIDGSAIPGVPGGSGTLNTIPLWTPDGDTLGNSIITQPSTGVVRVSGNGVYFSILDTSAAARNIDIGHWVAGQTNIESVGGILSIGTQSNHNIVFETNGSTKATILANGNVGIGTTTNINAPLTIQSDGSASTINLIGRSNGVYDESIISFYDFDQTTRKGYILNSGGNMFFATGNGSENMTILSGGNVGIGTTSPTNYKLEVSGNVKGDSFGTDQNTTARIFAPSGAAYNGDGNQTGYLIMELPDNAGAGVNNMMSGVIRVFDYAFGESFDVRFSGYWYSGYSWINCTAYVINEPGVERNFPVRFGKSTGASGSEDRPYIAIGDTASTWSYCKFSVIEYTSGHSNMNLYKWNSGWAASLSSTLPGSVLVTVSNTQTNNWKRANNNLYSGNSGNVGIGTTSPASKLEVSGRISGGELGNPKITRNGLSLYVDFNDKACVSGTSATEQPTDLGPNQYNLTLHGGANFEYKGGIGTYYFDGVNDRINVNDFVVADTSNSYEFWHYANAQSGWETIWDSGNERPLLGTYDNNLKAYPNGTNLATIDTGKWYHLVFAFASDSNLDVYVNGNKVADSLNWGSNQRQGTFQAWLGGDPSAETTNGFIAIARTYTRQLNADDVLQNYNAEVEIFATQTPSLGLVSAGGNVGVGTNTPSSLLEVKRLSSDRTTLSTIVGVTSQGSGPYTGFGGKISFNSNIYYGATTPGIIETAYVGAVIGATYETYSDLVFGTRQNATTVDEKMRIAGKGEVLIGTTAIVSDVKLRIVQTANQWPMQIVSNYAYGLSIDTSLGTDSNAGSLQVYPNSGGGFIVRNDSKVGIGTTNFASTSNLQLKMGNMGSGIVGEIFDAVDNADNSRIIVCGGGIGTPQFSMRHYSAGYGIDMWLDTSSPWDTYIDNRNAASGFIFRNNCNNDGGEDQLMRITGSGNVGIGPSVTNPIHKLEVRDGTISGEIAKFSAINPLVVIEASSAGNAALFLKPNATGSKRGEFRVTNADDYGFIWTADTSVSGTAYMELEASSTGGGDLTVKGDVIAYGAPSDKKYKENIRPIESALDKAMQLQGVTFDWKDNDSILDIKEDIGFIAQDVEKVLPELVRENKKGNLSLRYQGITPILLEAIKELKAEIEELKKQIK